MTVIGFLTSWLADVPGQAVPYALGALGLIVSERAGVLSLTGEGLMLIGAFSGVAACVLLGGHPIFACLVAMLASAIVATIFAFLVTTLHANQIIAGLSMVFFCEGLTTLLGSLTGLNNHAVIGLAKMDLSPFSHLALVGRLLFAQDPIVYVTPLIFVVAYRILWKTGIGLKLRAVGEDPVAADAAGVSVWRFRFLAILVGSSMVGLAGAYLSVVNTKIWISSMTGGRGWIAVALVIFAQWRPWRALAGALLFGGIEALIPHIAATGIRVPQYFVLMTPYVATLLVMILAGRDRRWSADTPSSLGTSFVREER